jgi:hypothetical protein
LTSSLFQIIGLITVAVGIGLIWIPAGIIATGVAITLIGLALEKGE